MGWLRTRMPPPALEPCNEDSLPERVPDLRGTWKGVRSEGVGEFLQHGLGQPLWQAKIAPLLIRFAHQERIEQCGMRVAITGGTGRRWVVHTLTADGTLENGVADLTIGGRPVRASGAYEDGRLVLHGRREEGEFLVIRELQGSDLVVTASPADGAPKMRIFCRRVSTEPVRAERVDTVKEETR